METRKENTNLAVLFPGHPVSHVPVSVGVRQGALAVRFVLFPVAWEEWHANTHADERANEREREGGGRGKFVWVSGGGGRRKEEKNKHSTGRNKNLRSALR